MLGALMKVYMNPILTYDLVLLNMRHRQQRMSSI